MKSDISRLEKRRIEARRIHEFVGKYRSSLGRAVVSFEYVGEVTDSDEEK